MDNQKLLNQLSAHNEAEQPVIEHIQIPIKNLHPALEGFTIALLGDFHLYPLTTLNLVRRVVDMANSLKPDLTVLVGDYVWRDVEAIFDLTPALAKLNAKYGVYSALGNHDLWTDVEIIRRGFQQARLPLLENEGLTLNIGPAKLNLAGLDDGWAGKPDLDAALTGLPPDAPTILLLHEPDLAKTYALDGRIALQLSGHSHGGQVRLPKIGPMILPYLGRKYSMGLYNVNGMQLYTTRGVGVTNLPIRYNCPPEVTHITLYE